MRERQSAQMDFDDWKQREIFRVVVVQGCTRIEGYLNLLVFDGFIATAAVDDHCSTSPYHRVDHFKYLQKCNENGTFPPKFWKSGHFEVCGENGNFVKNPRRPRSSCKWEGRTDPRKRPVYSLNDSFGVPICTLQGSQTLFPQASKEEEQANTEAR